jgi:hypothetical protein
VVNNFFFENHAVFEKMWKNCTAGTTDGNMAQARCMLDM